MLNYVKTAFRCTPDTDLAAVSLFLDTNMAAVTSCESPLHKHS